MKETFSVDQNLTFKEWYSATLFFSLFTKFVHYFFIFFTLMSILRLYLDIHEFSGSWNLLHVLSFFLPMAIFIFVVAVILFIICLSIYKLMPHLFQNISYEFSNWGIERNGGKTEFSKPWNEISKFKESRLFILIFPKTLDFHIIQKTQFESINELNNFRNFLKEKTNS